MSSGVTRRVRRAATAAACLLSSVILTVTLGGSGTAFAEPLNSDTIPGEDITFPWTTVGLPDDVTLVGANNTQSFTVPVPSGFTARRLRGLIHAPMDFGAGFVEIDDSRGTLLATVDLPAVTPDQAVVPFDVDVSAALVGSTGVGLSFTVREAPLPVEQRCGLGQQLLLSDLAAVFAGNEPAPTTIATFFPPVLQRLTIYAPTDAESAEQQAVLTLASAVARMYRPQAPAITVVTQPRGATPPPTPQFTRAVVVENGDAGTNLVNADRPNVYLKMTGRGNQLTDQVAIVVDQLQSLIQVPTARVDNAGSSRDPLTDELSFGRLKLTGERAVLRTSTLTVGVDRSALGTGRVDGLQVHLLATHTPVAALDSASLVVSVDGQAVYTTPLTDSGRVDAVFDVPSDFLRQRIDFEYALAYSPRQLCSPTTAPLTFQIDPRSTLTVRHGGQALDGFSAVPSEFNPEFLVALDGSDPGLLDYATRGVTDIARLTGTSLMPRVVDVESAADSTTAGLIVANATTLGRTSLRLPIGGESTDVRVDLRGELRASIDKGVGSIQAFADTPRNRSVVVITTSGEWSLVEPLFGYIDQLPGGWSSLDGNVVAAGAAGSVTNLSIGPGEVAPAPADEGISRTTWLAVGAGCVVLAGLVIGAVLWSRRRRGAAEPVAPAPPVQ
ncbi:cellulose biosynthesis cyclic di-GMP-binding regulatory protein BcsB [Mycobacterium antarcticum]|uniref:cellulose biosynthesis cyclic di-GMP-binding regulatory protein BcsB n=1 Tax=Mycolicibacterium sp. TUM20984 TaxID=3023368 RepID=UPI0024E15F04|nr:cellulose biosynthesis cyclic di-GMP-binding regulatory protein BcsB [Mycolicibacterium sp. TUM20984]